MANRRWLKAGRAAWLLAAVVLTSLHLRGLLNLLQTPQNICVDSSNCTVEQANAYVQQLGLNPDLVAVLDIFAIALVVPLACLGVAVAIIWRGGGSPIALATATVLLLYGLPIGSDMVTSGLGPVPWGATLDLLIETAFIGALAYTLHTFPNGRFVPDWGRLALIVEWLTIGALALTIGLSGEPAAAALVAILLLGLGSQVYRYRRGATPVERQQIKWGLTGLIGFALNGVLWLAVVEPAGRLGAAGLSVYLAFVPFSLVLVLSLPITLAIAVLRYRLWDIDVLIRRTLIYSALTAVLTLTYLGLVVVLQAVAGQLTGQSSSALVTVLSTLAIAALFAPVRQRVQRFVDQRFYRSKYDTAQTLAAFSMQARNEVDLDRLTDDLRASVTEAMQPAHVELWLRH
jgi:hypothetical protein